MTGAACETRRIERLSCTSPTADLAAAVVIPAHNAAATIARQLTALAGQRSAPMFELVVVANTCTDATAAISRGFVEGRPRWQVIEADAIASAGYARNRGVAATTAPLLLFCDADDRVGPGWVAAMVAALDHAEIVGGWLRPDAGNAPSWLRIAPGYPRQARIGLTEFDGRLWFPPTASFGCRRSAFEAAGGFTHQASGEDLELAVALSRAGGRVGATELADFDYLCRQTAAGFVRQQRADHRANAANLALAGRLPATSATRGPWQLARAMASYARREHICHPRFHALLVQLEWVRRQAHRAAVADAIRAPDHAEAMLPPSAPLLGGLLFDVSMEAAADWQRSMTDPHVLVAIQRLCPPGASVAVLGAGDGFTPVAASIATNPSGSVMVFDEHPDALAQRNLARHRRRAPAVLTDDPARFVATAAAQRGQGTVHTFCVHSLGSRERALLTDLVAAQPAASIIVDLTATRGFTTGAEVAGGSAESLVHLLTEGSGRQLVIWARGGVPQAVTAPTDEEIAAIEHGLVAGERILVAARPEVLTGFCDSPPDAP